MPWLAQLDAKAQSWPKSAYLSYLVLKWSLVALGAFALVGNIALKWGAPAAIWFLVVPFLYGVFRAWPRAR